MIRFSTSLAYPVQNFIKHGSTVKYFMIMRDLLDYKVASPTLHQPIYPALDSSVSKFQWLLNFVERRICRLYFTLLSI